MSAKINLNNYLPRIAKALEEQNIVSFKQVEDRIAKLFEQQDIKDSFDGKIPPKQALCNIMLKSQARSPFTKIISEQESGTEKNTNESYTYKPVAKILALALKTSEYSLFGLSPSFKLSKTLLPENPEEKAIALNSIFSPFKPEEPQSPEEASEYTALQQAITRALLSLTAKEERVIRERFFKDKTLEEISNNFNTTIERIRQWEAKALRKLKHPGKSKTLRMTWTGSSTSEYEHNIPTKSTHIDEPLRFNNRYAAQQYHNKWLQERGLPGSNLE